MNFRTDLALERREVLDDQQQNGIISEEQSIDNAKITRITVTNAEGEKAIGKPIGKYITVEVPPFSDDAELFDGRLTAVSQELKNLLPPTGLVLIAGLGNSNITPDALGPQTIDLILATRHIGGELARSAGLLNLRPVAGIVPGVLGQTGMETGEIILGIVNTIHPDAVIVVDALASRRLSRLGCTVQISDTGIVPGSGVGNSRKEISRESLGVPVISMGVPTVVDANTIVHDVLEETGELPEESLSRIRESIEPRGAKMMVTPREIDLMIERAARLIAMGINCALQTSMSAEDIFALVS